MTPINFKATTKGIGVSSVIKLVLAVMITSLFISMSTIGSLGDAIQHSFTNLEDTTGQEVEIEDKQAFSSLYEFVRDRALNRGCDIVEERNDGEGYEGLAGTYLTEEPACFGGDASWLRDGGAINWGGLGVDEDFMPGIYSREDFILNRDITLQVSGDGTTPIEGLEIDGEPDHVGILPPFNDSIRQYTEGEAELEVDDDGGLSVGTVVVGSAAVGSAVGPAGTVGGAAIGAVLGVTIGSIADDYLDEQPGMSAVLIFFEADIDSYERTNNLDEGEEMEDLDDGNVEVKLCEGDIGYIQSNRGSIDDPSYSDGDPLIPVVVITEAEQKTC